MVQSLTAGDPVVSSRSGVVLRTLGAKHSHAVSEESWRVRRSKTANTIAVLF